MDDLISRQMAIDALMAILDKPSHAEFLYTDEICGALNGLPSAQPESCDGCKWEYAFGYGECHHCKRSFNDMYKRGEQE